MPNWLSLWLVPWPGYPQMTMSNGLLPIQSLPKSHLGPLMEKGLPGFKPLDRYCWLYFLHSTIYLDFNHNLNLSTRRNYSVISPVLLGPCTEFGAIWSAGEAPKSCRAILSPAEGWLHHLHLHQQLGHRFTGLSWLRPSPDFLFTKFSSPLQAADSPWVSVPVIFLSRSVSSHPGTIRM